MAAVMFHALVALVKAGPCSTQRELMEQIRKHTSPNIAEYAQVHGVQRRMISVDIFFFAMSGLFFFFAVLLLFYVT